MKIGVDVGTSVTKAALFDDDGRMTAQRSAPTVQQRPEAGRYEHDPARIVDAVLDLLSDLPTDEVNLVAVTGQGDGLWLLDQAGAPIRPALSWMDNRGAPDCGAWTDSGVTATIFQRTGNTPFPGSGAALLSALHRSEPAVLAAAETATQCQHTIFQALTGVRTATRSAAMLGVFDPVRGGYDDVVLELTGLAPYSRLLPPISEPAVALAPLRTPLGERTGLKPGTLVATGPYDLPAAALGTGVTDPGDGLVIIGTTLACLVVDDAVRTEGEPAGFTLRTADDDRYLRAMAAMVGTAGLDWLLGLVGASHADLDALLGSSAPGANGVTALPYLSPAGERAPFADPAASAQFAGLSLATTAADLVRALCESLAYAARHCLDAAGLTGSVTVAGGGAASAALLSVFADVLGQPISIAGQPEATAWGAVSAADLALGRTPRPLAGRSTAVRPEPANRSRFDDGYAAYLGRVTEARARGWSAGRQSPARRPAVPTNWPSAGTHGLRALLKE